MTKTPHSRNPALPIAATWLLVGCLSACTKAEPPPPSTPTPTTIAATAPTAATAAVPPGGALPAKLCSVLRGQVLQVKGMSGIGARSQLVMAIGTAFDADATALGTVSSDIDAIAAADCPDVSTPLLAATRTKSLQEAVR